VGENSISKVMKLLRILSLCGQFRGRHQGWLHLGQIWF
jgi:hypothetical protein